MNKQAAVNHLKSKGLNAVNLNGVVMVYAPGDQFDAIRSLAASAIKEIGYGCSWGIVPARKEQSDSKGENISDTTTFTTEDETGQLIFT